MPKPKILVMREKWGPDVLCAVCGQPGCNLSPIGGPHMMKGGRTAYYHENPCYNDLLAKEAAQPVSAGLALALAEL